MAIATLLGNWVLMEQILAVPLRSLMTNIKGARRMELMDVAGRILRTQQVEAGLSFLEWSLEGFPAGTYVLVLSQDGKTTHVEPVVKE